MDKEIVVAIIGTAAVILGTVITGIFSLASKPKQSQNSNNVEVKQTQNGQNNTQIGVQNNYVGKSSDLDAVVDEKIEKYMEEHTLSNDEIDALLGLKTIKVDIPNKAGGKTAIIDSVSTIAKAIEKELSEI